MLVPSFVARACGVLAGLTLGVVLPAQIKLPDPVQGRFRVDPKGHGPDVFRDFSSAVRFLSVIGVTGPLELVVAPGSHEGRLRFFPTPGQKPGQKILIRSAVPGEARLSAADSAILELLDTAHDLVLDGFVFETKGRDAAILVSGASKNIEIRNCRFVQVEGAASKVIEIQGRQTSGFEIHHNKFELRNVSYGIYTQGTTSLHIHHNDFLCVDAGEPVSIWNSNKSKSSVHHNVFRGRVNRTAVRLNVSGHDVDVYGNLFLLETGGPRYPAIGSRGLRTAWNRIYHNIFVLFGEGPVLQSLGPIEINNNSYAVEGEALGRIENTDYGSLDEWRDALSDVARNEQADQGSVLAGRGFFDKHTRLLKVFHDFEAHEASVEVEGGAKEGGAPAKSAGEGQEQDVVAERVERRAHLDYLKGLLKDQDPVVVHLAIRALRKLGRAASPAVAGLGRLCNHSHAPIRAEAVTALGEIRIGAEIVIPELLVLLSDKDIHVVLPAIKTLQGFAHLARQAEADLRRLEKHSDERVREAAKAALVDILKQD